MRKNRSFALKGLFIGIIVIVLLIPITLIRATIDERQSLSNDVEQEISASWGPRMTVEDIYLYHGEKRKQSPSSIQIDARLDPQQLHRSIYETCVYGADMKINGVFRDSTLNSAMTNKLVLKFNDLSSIRKEVVVNFDGQSYPMRIQRLEDSGYILVAEVRPMEKKEEYTFSLQVEFNGTKSLDFKNFGDAMEIGIHSTWPSPSFTGNHLPDTREISDEGFTAHWSLMNIYANQNAGSFGVCLVDPVNGYTLSDRCTKYAILVILLVFVAAVIVELISKREISLVQYAIIGLSLALFYCLVLAFSEFIPFGAAYLIAALMTTASLGGYFLGILRHRSAWLLTGLTVLAYVVMYILLSLEAYALLAGSIVLFLLLVALMTLTARGSTSDKEDDRRNGGYAPNDCSTEIE